MTRRLWLLVAVLFAFFGDLNGQSQQPNFVLIIADDMSWDDLGAYGHPTIRTPNLDRMAAEGMRFDRAFLTTSSCSPSRSSIITGRYPHNTGARQLHWPLPGEQLTFVELLREAGYWTAAAGKWHLGDAVRSRFDLVREGGGESGSEYWVPIMQERPPDKPFFLWLAAIDPHRPYEENIIENSHRSEDVVLPPYMPDVPDTRRDMALYYDEVARLDDYTGKVLEELEKQGVSNNTLVLFISDNGRPFPRDKTTLYDSGMRTPWIVRWPDRVQPGTFSASLVCAIDIAPTFLALAGVPSPPRFQGLNFAPILELPETEIRSYVFAEANWHDYDNHMRAVRDKRYKYIRNYFHETSGTPPADAVSGYAFQAIRKLRDAGELTAYQMAAYFTPRPFEELYDVETDPHEMNNLASEAEHIGTLNRLRQVLDDWQSATHDNIPQVRSPDQFDRETGDPLPDFESLRMLRMSMQ